jgi:hypothetical protein
MLHILSPAECLLPGEEGKIPSNPGVAGNRVRQFNEIPALHPSGGNEIPELKALQRRTILIYNVGRLHDIVPANAAIGNHADKPF